MFPFLIPLLLLLILWKLTRTQREEQKNARRQIRAQELKQMVENRKDIFLGRVPATGKPYLLLFICSFVVALLVLERFL